MVLLTPNEETRVFIECNQCGSREELPYGQWANSEVPEGWLRGSDDKTHYCPECRDGKYESTIGVVTEVKRTDGPTLYQTDQGGYTYRNPHDNDKIDVNAQGGKQSHVDGAAHRLDPRAMLSLVGVLGFGDKKYNEEMCPIGDENWRKLHHYDHINHALVHMFKYMLELQYGPAPDDDEAGEHLDHALCRLMFAVGSKPSV